MKDMIIKLIKLALVFVLLVVMGLLTVAVFVINPWNTPAIFKRNYPEWFAAHPFLDAIISVD